MNIFWWILICIGIIYSALNILAGVFQLKKSNIEKWSCILMIVGGLLIIVSIFLYAKIGIFIIVFALAIIHIATVNNGFKLYGKLNFKHHIIRMEISILIIILYLIK